MLDARRLAVTGAFCYLVDRQADSIKGADTTSAGVDAAAWWRTAGDVTAPAATYTGMLQP